MHLNHMNPEFNPTHTEFIGRWTLHIHWNGPVISRADHLLSASLGGWFGNWWNLKTGTSKFDTSKVVDRKKSKVSRLSLLKKKTS